MGAEVVRREGKAKEGKGGDEEQEIKKQGKEDERQRKSRNTEGGEEN